MHPEWIRPCDEPTRRDHKARRLMDAIFFLLPIAVLLGAVFAILFVVAVKRGQFDDLGDPPERILKDD